MAEVSRPKLLDTYCCEGGASEGYRRAGFDVFGVDLFEDYSQKRYPFPSHKGDAVAFILEHGHEFDAIHASPPCQDASAGTRALRAAGTHSYPRLIEVTREALVAVGKPWVIENVKGAELRDPLMLCGSMFDLAAIDTDGMPVRLERHRLFESSLPLVAPRPDVHDTDVWVAGSYGGARRDKYEARYVRKGGYVPVKKVQQALLGIDWMTERGMYQSLPPAYCEWVGGQLMREVLTRREDVQLEFDLAVVA